MKTHYVSICEKYGAGPYVAALGAFALATMTNHPKLALSLLYGLILAAPGDGLVAPENRHGIIGGFLSKHRVGQIRGSKILRGFQFTCVAMALCVGTGLEYLDHNKHALPNPKNGVATHAIDKRPVKPNDSLPKNIVINPPHP